MVEIPRENTPENDPSHGHGKGPEQYIRNSEEMARMQQEAGETAELRETQAKLKSLTQEIETTKVDNFIENKIAQWRKKNGWEGSEETIFAKLREANPDVKFVKVTEAIQKKFIDAKMNEIHKKYLKKAQKERSAGVTTLNETERSNASAEITKAASKIRAQWPLGKHYIIAQKEISLRLPGELWPSAATSTAPTTPDTQAQQEAKRATLDAPAAPSAAASAAAAPSPDTQAQQETKHKTLYDEAAERRSRSYAARESRRENDAKTRGTEAALAHRAGKRQEALRKADVNLDRKESFTFDDSLKPLYESKNWNTWQNEWTFVQGHLGVESLLNTAVTFQSQTFHLKQLREAMRQDPNQKTLEFGDLMNRVYSRSLAPGAHNLLNKILKQNGHAELDPKIKNLIQGLSFTQDYARLLAAKNVPGEVIEAFRNIYLDVTELYEMLKLLRYEKPEKTARNSNDPNAPQEPEIPEGAKHLEEFLEKIFNTKEARNGIKRYRDAIRHSGDSLTYADIESGDAASLRREKSRKALAEQFDGKSIVTDLYAHCVKGSFEKSEEKITFDETKVLEFLNRLMEAGIREKIKKEWKNGDVNEAAVQNLLATWKLTSIDETPKPEQQQFLRDGYFQYAVLRHAEQIPEGNHESLRTLPNGAPVKMELPIGFAEELVDSLQTQGVDLNQSDIARIREHIAGGVVLGVLDQVSTDGAVTDRSLSRIGGGISMPLLHLSGGRTLGAEVGVLFNTQSPQSPTVGSQMVLGKAWPSGVRVNFHAGMGANSTGPTASVGIGLQVPLGPDGPVRLHVQAGAAVIPGVIALEAGVGLGWNSEGAYKKNLEKRLKKEGFMEIEALLTNNGSREQIAEAILKNPSFKSLEDAKKSLEQNLGKNLNDADFHQFAIDTYRAERYELSTQALDLHSISPIPQFGVKLVMLLVPGSPVPVAIPVPYITVTVAAIKIVYRTTTGLNYQRISDSQILTAFDEQFDTFYPPDTEEKIQLARLQPGQGGNLAVLVEQNNGDTEFTVEEKQRQNLEELNQSLNTIGLNLKKVELEGRGDNTGKKYNLLELDITNVHGNLDILPDPQLGNGVQLLHENGKYYLAIAPEVEFHIKRQNFFYPFKKDGEYARTVVTITQNPVTTMGDLADLERAPFLHQKPTFNAVEDYALFLDENGKTIKPESNNIRTLVEYLSGTSGREHMAYEGDVENIKAELDEIKKAYDAGLEKLGSVWIGEQIDQPTQDKLRTAAESIAGDVKKTTDRAFLTKFKQLSTFGEATFDLEALRKLCSEKGAKILNRPLNSSEVHYFMQMLNIYSMIQYDHEKHKTERVPYEGFVRRELAEMFTQKRYPRAQAMVDRIIDDLATQGESFSDALHQDMPGGVFGSLVGSDSVEGLRVLEEYRNDPIYEIFNLKKYDIDSTDPIERDIALAIIEVLNPIPAELQKFLRDDFAQRIGLAWFYRDRGEAEILIDLIDEAKHSDPAILKADLETNPERSALIKKFHDFVLKARAEETRSSPDSKDKRRLQLDEAGMYFLSFEDIETHFGIFERCGNVSMFLNEKIGIERVIKGQPKVVVLEDNNYRMVKPHAAVETVGLGAGVFVERVQTDEPHESGTGNEDEGAVEGEPAPTDDTQDNPFGL